MCPPLGEKKALPCTCLSSAFLGPEAAALEISWEGSPPQPGQFFLVKPRRSGTFLGRPLSVAGWDGAQKKLSFLVAPRGLGSREICDLRPSDGVDLIGPLGNAWAPADLEGGPIALVAGGIGAAPLLYFALELEKPGSALGPYDFFLGSRTAYINLPIKPRSFIIATDDGSQGQQGRIPSFFDPAPYRAVFTCGPEPMLRAIGLACMEKNIPCYVSTERMMACGVGACLGCTVETAGGNRRCCADGPIFPAQELYFEP
ncbi:MAG: dihydroorotate dehydrogenase electron transfer subunit [Treponema sp.]|nr:dihydroorotate dehydrogenase electron transfer subunit [Treponema sp.]